jgi:hypothetical protein
VQNSKFMEQTNGPDKNFAFLFLNSVPEWGMIYGYARVSTEAQDLTGSAPAVDRFSDDTTDLLIIAREMQRVGGYWPSRSFIPRPTCRARTPPHAKVTGVKFERKPKLTTHQQRRAVSHVFDSG